MDVLKLKGIIYIELLDGDGNIIKKNIVENLVTNDGFTSFMKAAVGEHDMVANRIVIGLGNTPELKIDKQLDERLIHIGISYEVIENTIVYSARFPEGSVDSNKWIREIGLAYFDGQSETLVTRAVFDADKEVFMTPNNVLNLKYQLSITST